LVLGSWSKINIGLLIALILVLNALNSGVVFAGCPSAPANGQYWVPDEFEDATEYEVNELECCCIWNEFGDWEDMGHSPVTNGCDCPSVPAE
jgi:hypothetical protein